MTDEKLYELALRVGATLKSKGMMMTTAESCTGGWIAQAVTAVPGSSEWFERGFVVYTYISKREMLGVKPETLEQHGAVSQETTREMTAGALARSHAQVAVSVSGTAGPSGGTPQKPVGTVCFGWGVKDGVVQVATQHFTGDREAVRRQAVVFALERVLAVLDAGAAV
jgi:nicotinamide-nucleotide amidase